MFSSAYLPPPLASYVSAHGFVHQFSVNGKTYTGARPRPNPIYGATTSAVNCGNGGGFIASEAAPVNPGDTLKFDWRGQDLSRVRMAHDTGPIVSYLADCGPAGCDKFDSKSARWFKIDEQGHKPNSAEWVQKDLMRGATANVKLPSNVAPGNYLMPEFYPSCIQLKIGGSGTGRPSANELVSFPGGYSDNDKGLFGNNFFSRQYTFPGPPLAKLTGGGGAPAPAPSSSTSTPTSTKSSSSTKAGSGSGAQPTQTTKSGGSTGSSGSSSRRSASAKPTAEVRPRHLSRVMRRIAFDESVHGVSA
ncbi:hypothetical protein FA13DRAFT_1839173 [Coprinellus micaceus]|uniref:AA9 family lytic polysaccharide monooxygenase n=1 Tax=Coprinellus micaceus TaxID=71717 RepID=A0A4Y7SEY9_COPMI|nr:hypothetical protein FA13DRAFT_1839173 [Coprinellus micaceus]